MQGDPATPRPRRHSAKSGNAFLLEMNATPQFGRLAGRRPQAVGTDESRVGTRPLRGACSPERAYKLQPLLPLRHSRTTGSLGRSRISGDASPALASRQLKAFSLHLPILSVRRLWLSIDGAETLGAVTAVERRSRYFFFPSAANWPRKTTRSSISLSVLRPGKSILVSGIFAFGPLMYSRNVASSQTMPDFLLADE